MVQLKYKTRGMTDPGRKNKVYFSCHPDDFSRFFDTVSDEILDRQNCAVWYRDESDPYVEEDHLSDLSRMQLFVMPVTAKLLNTKNRALDVEFKFAVDHHIPVLPIMQESGLGADFNARCGSLQYLDKFANDPTAISYGEKLTKFLSEVLIGDELAEKIRDAFDAYVFLSYRKKDRKYAQELMRLIHKNEFCRDIAIWYDEFLTPGENFNDSIKEALEKSGLFVLAVTPNLINEENYIMTTEYPMARREQKPVLPAELVPTDKDVLREKYDGIPECTDAHNSVALSDALLESIQKMAIKENDSSPEHNFFIGLAYLGGIDVEVDHERALSLITSAAEAGLLEAVEKLVSMYMAGDGVARSFEKAIVWQKKAAELYGESFYKELTWESLESWLVSYIGIAGKYSVMNRDKDAIDTYHHIIKICDSIAHLTESDKLVDNTRLRYKAQACMFAASSYNSETDRKKAIQYSRKALDILEPLYNEDFVRGSAWIKKDYANSLSFVGENYRLSNDIDTALTYFTKACAIKKENYERYKDLFFAIDYAQGLVTVASISLLRYETDAASENYLKAMAVLDLAEQEDGTGQTVPLYVDCALSYSTVLRTVGDQEGLLELLGKIIERINEYYEESGVMLYYSAFRAHIFLGQAYYMQEAFAKARGPLYDAERLNREFYLTHGKVIDVPLTLSVYSLIANVEYRERDLVTARRYLSSAVTYAEECLKLGYNVHAMDCAAVYSLYSSLEFEEENFAEGKRYIERAVDILESNDLSETDMRALPMYFSIYINYAVLKFEENDMRGAATYGQKCIDLYRNYEKIAPGIAQMANIVPSYYLVALAKSQLDKKEAKSYMLESCEYFERAVRENASVNNYDGLATMYLCLSGIAGLLERSKWTKKATKIIEYMEVAFEEEFPGTHVYGLINENDN